MHLGLSKTPAAPSLLNISSLQIQPGWIWDIASPVFKILWKWAWLVIHDNGLSHILCLFCLCKWDKAVVSSTSQPCMISLETAVSQHELSVWVVLLKMKYFRAFFLWCEFCFHLILKACYGYENKSNLLEFYSPPWNLIEDCKRLIEEKTKFVSWKSRLIIIPVCVLE